MLTVTERLDLENADLMKEISIEELKLQNLQRDLNLTLNLGLESLINHIQGKEVVSTENIFGFNLIDTSVKLSKEDIGEDPLNTTQMQTIGNKFLLMISQLQEGILNIFSNISHMNKTIEINNLVKLQQLKSDIHSKKFTSVHSFNNETINKKLGVYFGMHEEFDIKSYDEFLRIPNTMFEKGIGEYYKNNILNILTGALFLNKTSEIHTPSVELLKKFKDYEIKKWFNNKSSIVSYGLMTNLIGDKVGIHSIIGHNFKGGDEPEYGQTVDYNHFNISRERFYGKSIKLNSTSDVLKMIENAEHLSKDYKKLGKDIDELVSAGGWKTFFAHLILQIKAALGVTGAVVGFGLAFTTGGIGSLIGLALYLVSAGVTINSISGMIRNIFNSVSMLITTSIRLQRSQAEGIDLVYNIAKESLSHG